MPIFQQVGIKASEDRLENLINERLKPGANKEEIDERIWDLFGENWSVMFTDLSGFSRNVAKFGIIHFLQVIYESHRLLIPIINSYDGILLKKEGDSMLIIFKRATRAIDCAVEMQKVLKEYNKTKPDEEKVLLCVGIGYGLILKIGDDDVFGAEVNSASKLGEDTAKSEEILVTEPIFEFFPNDSKYKFEKLAESPSGMKNAFKLIY
ncbi:MAG: adenylate/guanylate cyclase domain-containing protein [Leptospiraceae bacterium]|nr:adenylate/guanylate cyclase domain-containing protein [Leptospiraceae bacterium]